MKRWSIFALILSSVLFSCGREVVQSGRYLLNDLSVLKDSNFLAGSGRVVTVIPLESSKESLMGKVLKVALSSEFIFVQDNKDLFQFHRDGRFVRKIGNFGRGPQEHMNITDFTVVEGRQMIYIADNDYFTQYDFDGNFIKKIKMGYLRRFEVFGDGDFIITPAVQYGNEPYKLIFKNESGDTTARFKNLILYKSKTMYLYGQRKSICKVGGGFIFHQQFTDSVFTINTRDKSLDYRYSFDFGSSALTTKTLEEGLEAVNKSVYISDLTETSDFIYLYCRSMGKNEKYAINKTTGEACKPVFYIQDLMFDFWPKWQYGDSVMIDVVPALHLIEKRDSLPDSSIRPTLMQLDENSNSLLVIIKVE